MANTSTPRTLLLRDLPFAARLVLALFMTSVGIGYLSALVNLHFQSAQAGEPLPTPDDAVNTYNGGKGRGSQIERLLTASPALPFNGQGSMRPAFMKKKVRGWDAMAETKAAAMKQRLGREINLDDPGDEAAVTKEVHGDLDGERQAVLLWVRGGLDKKAYDDDALPLPEELSKKAITEKFVTRKNNQSVVKIQSILRARCAACHSEKRSVPEIPLETYKQIAAYGEAPGGMSLPKLALTTHVHLLGFSMLYGLTGLVLAFSSYPRILRVVLCPLPLLAQIVDISFWWLGRLESPYGPMFAAAIVFSGAVVAGSLMLQIVLTLWDLFGRAGKTVIVLLLAAAAAGGYLAKTRVIDPYLLQEAGSIAPTKE